MSMTPYLIPISAAVLLLIVVAVVVLRYLLTPRITAPLCGRCRYDVTGLPSDVCPECGANLHEVGILKPGSVKPMGRVMRLALWTISVAAVAVIVTPPILRSVPPLNQTTLQHTLAMPGSRLYKSVVIDAIRSWRSDSQTASVELNVTLRRLDDQNFEMQVFPERNQCNFKDSKGETIREDLPIEDADAAAQAVTAWLNASGIAATGGELKPEAKQIAKEIKESIVPPQRFRLDSPVVTTGTFGTQLRGFRSDSLRSGFGAPFSSTAMQMSSGRVADPWPLRIAIGWWSLLWLLGIGVILLVAVRRNPTDPGVQ